MTRCRCILFVLALAGAASAATDELHVGDVIELRHDVLLEFPARDLRITPSKERGPVELRDVTVSFDGAAPEEVGERWARVRIEAQLFGVGSVEIPDIPYELLDGGGVVLREGHLEGETVEVVPLLSREDEAALAGLAPPAEVPLRRERLAILAAAAAALLAGVALLLRAALRRFRRRIGERPAPASRPVEEVALARLDRLLAGGALRDGDARRFHIELAAIVKGYLEERFAFPALERTTGEVGRDLRPLAVDVQVQRLTLEILQGCDGVKFAGERPGLEAMRERVAQARQVVERTAREAVADPPPTRRGGRA